MTVSTPREFLTEGSLASLGERPFGVYVHVPFCSVRCGYCDFNTYTADELGEGATRASYADTAIAEIHQAANLLAGTPPLETVFFGGGTPTQLPPGDLVRIVSALRESFGFIPAIEVTTEANPDSVTPQSLATLREGGINRISFGVQSAVPHVLATLDRTHRPEGVPDAVRWARAAGFDQLSVDLIYGTPGESMDDWRRSLDHAISLEPDHVSAYALIVEQGTALARRVARGEIAVPDDDEMADKYILADSLLETAGFGWYELSNWARDEASRCRHNELYWEGANWWGVGPGAHSHIDGNRWWNVKHPAAYANRLNAGESPVMDFETLDEATKLTERVLLESRLCAGLDPTILDPSARPAVAELVDEGLIDAGARLVLTLKGRLLADAVVRRLVP
ncbi:MAG: radical SAM family heme chaperone HemW [Actinomycetota bacterium]|nr:radical SAM family heme chaperone HemW [Actinomycetota bacterium]